MQKKVFISLFALLLLSTFLTSNVSAQDDIDVTVNSTVASKYVWRGIVIVDEPVWQPSLEVALGNLSFSAWANIDLTDVNDYGPEHGDGQFRPTEIDYTASYAIDLTGISLSGGVIHYTFPNTPFDSTTEFFVSGGLDMAVQPAITFYKDIDQADGVYITFSATHSVENIFDGESGINMSLGLYAHVAYATEDHNAFYYGVSENSFADFFVSMEAPVVMSEGITLTPSVALSAFIDEAIRDSLEDSETIIAALSLSYSF